jgi:predicted 3-demethylubiquinone-9 3-methyltransferase (glyoxalase superfamily)
MRVKYPLRGQAGACVGILAEDGGKTIASGWLTGKFGLSRQVTPVLLPTLIADPDRAKASPVVQAMMKMDIGKLQAAANAQLKL